MTPVDPKSAIAYWRNKQIVDPETYRALDAEEKQRAFSVAGIADLDLLEQVYSSLDTALSEGISFQDWKPLVEDELVRAWAGTVANPGWRLETIFRTNIQSAYQAGNYDTAKEQRSDRPYGLLMVIEDGATSDICQDLDEQFGGKAIALDDPIWQTIWPPNHYNCRSDVDTLTEEQAIEAGILDDPDEAEVAEGFDIPPGSIGEVDPEEYSEDLSEFLEAFID
jgi:SPP1 gp7 family putative phage head morphogenesis protein